MSSFPYVAAEHFEAGTLGIFDTETDTGSQLDFPHYATLSRFGLAPYRGAYCCRVKLTGGTTAAYLIETGSLDTAAAATAHAGFYFYLAPDFTMADTDKFIMFDLESTLNTTSEAAMGLIRTGANVLVWTAQTAAAAAQTLSLGTLDPPGHPNSCLGTWHHVAMSATNDPGANDGTIDVWLDGVLVGAQITGLNQAAVVNGRLGVIGPDAGTKGTILFDDFIVDNARLYPNKERFPRIFPVTKTQHVFVGPGWVSGAALLTLGADDILTLWDTDVGNVDDDTGYIVQLDGNVQTAAEGPFHFKRGCYATISGTNPLGQVFLIVNNETQGVVGPLNYSQRGMIDYGRQRKNKLYGI
jgi:hypothetical protein